jgi:hypothetical protein
MKATMIILSLLCHCQMASSKAASLKGSHRRLENLLVDSRLLNVNWNNDGKDPGKKKDSDIEEGGENGPDTVSSVTSAPTLRPTSNPMLAPVSSPSSSIPATPTSNPTTSSVSMPHTSAPTTLTLNPTASKGGDGPDIVFPFTSAPTLRPASNPTLVPVSSPNSSIPRTPTSSPTTSSVSTPHTSAPISLTLNPTTSTSGPTILSSNSMTITRGLLPFDVTLEGSADQFDEVNEPLKISLEFFLESKLGEFFESIRTIELEEVNFENVQRQIIRRGFSFGGQAKFSDYDVPSTEEVHDAQRLILRDYMFEWSEILKDNGIFLDVVDVALDGDNTEEGDDKIAVDDNNGSSLDDDDASVLGVIGDGGNGGNSDDDNATIIWVALVAAGLVLALGYFVVQRRRPSEIEDESLALDEPEQDKDFMIDTGDASPLTWNNIFRLSTGEIEEFEEIPPKPETEFMNVPMLGKAEVINLQRVARVSNNRGAIVVDTYHNNDRMYSRPANSDEDLEKCVVA